MFFSPPFLHFQSSTLCSVVYPYAATPSSSFSAFGRSWRFQQHSDFQRLQCFRQQSDRSEAVAVSLSLSSLAAAEALSNSVYKHLHWNKNGGIPCCNVLLLSMLCWLLSLPTNGIHIYLISSIQQLIF